MRRQRLSLRQRLFLATGASMSVAGMALGALAGVADRGHVATMPAWSTTPLMACGGIILLAGLGIVLSRGVARPRRISR